jgi:hypothetical protein
MQSMANGPVIMNSQKIADFRVMARAEVESSRKRQKERQKIEDLVSDPLTWLQSHTQTKDPHWREAGASSPYRPFPQKPYFRPIVEAYQREAVVFVEKSRDMMLSWLTVGFLTHACMTTKGIEAIFQSQTEDKAAELVDYAKCLYDNQSEELRNIFPVAEPTADQSWLELRFANNSRIVGIPHGASKLRSYHPWALFIDEAAFVPDAGESYDEAISACQKILVVSSANVGWFEAVCTSAE